MSRSRRLRALRVGAWLAASAFGPVALAATEAAPATSSASGWALALAGLGVAALAGLWWRRERRLADELQSARVHAHTLAELLDVWQWRSNAEHRLVQWRPPQGAPASAWSGAAVGTPVWSQFRCPDERALRALLDAHAGVEDLSAELRLADGGMAQCQLRAKAVTDARGRFAGYVGTARVMGMKAAAPATDSATAPSNASAAAPHAEAPPATPESEQESFSYTVSHDLRAPIRVVEGFTKILKEDYGRLLDRIGNDHLDRVLGAAARMNHMIDALLALSQLSTQPLARQPVNLSQLACYIADDLRRQAPERTVSIHIEPGMQVHGDPTLLRVALENLLGNAWKYTAKSRDAQIWFGHDPAQPPHCFTVQDNGAGFDMRFADRLFGVFQRLHSASDFQGTGVGLASVRRIVRRHGGDIWAEAEVDRGASFHFTLK